MPFTFNNYQPLTPEQTNPMAALLSNALKAYQGVTNAGFQKREKEADIFAKELGPLATLASNPNFTGFNPQVQKMIAQRIGGYLKGGQGMQEPSAESTPGYAEDNNIYERLKHGADTIYGQGGRLAVGRANLAGAAEKFGLPKAISEVIGNSKLSGEQADFEQAKEEAIQKLKLKGYSDEAARDILKVKPGETNETYNKRIKPLFIASQKEEERPLAHEEERNPEVAQEDLEATAKAFNTTPEKVLEAQRMGVKTAKEFRGFLKWSQE